MSKVGLIYLALVVFTFALESCCDGETVYTYDQLSLRINDSRLHAFDYADTNTNYYIINSDTVFGRFKIDIHYSWSYTVVNSCPVGIISSAYATSCPESWTNYMIDSTLAISINKDLIANSDTFLMGTNLLEANINGIERKPGYGEDAVIEFGDSLILNSNWSKLSPITFLLKIESNLGDEIEENREVTWLSIDDYH